MKPDNKDIAENTHSTIAYYDEHAEEFVRNTVKADMSAAYKHFEKYLPERAYILDAGCGSGRDSLYFMNQGYRVMAFDASEAMCREAEQLLQQKVEQMTFDQLSFDAEFDGIWACASLLHIAETELAGVLAKILRALKKDGVLYASWKYGSSERTDEAGRFFCDMTRERLEAWLKDIPQAVVEEFWFSEDVRPERKTQQWINLIIRKRSTKGKAV